MNAEYWNRWRRRRGIVTRTRTATCSFNSLPQSSSTLKTACRWEGYQESRRCSRDTYPESYLTKDTHVQWWTLNIEARWGGGGGLRQDGYMWYQFQGPGCLDSIQIPISFAPKQFNPEHCVWYSNEVSLGEKILWSGTDPDSYLTEYTLVYED